MTVMQKEQYLSKYCINREVVYESRNCLEFSLIL